MYLHDTSMLPMNQETDHNDRNRNGIRRVKSDQPLSTGKATKLINAIASDAEFSVMWRNHAFEQMEDRGLIVGDVLHVLKRGFVLDEAQPSTREGYYKYRIEGATPSSENRTVRLVVIPGDDFLIKVITVMWADEQMTRK